MSAKAFSGELGVLVEQLGEIAGDARREFGGLSAAQVNWKPREAEWSVGQCFEHLIKTNEGFFRVLEQLARGERKSSAWESWSPLSGFFGRMVLSAVSKQGGRKFKAPAKLQPSSSGVEPDIVGRFEQHQARLGELMAATANADLKRTVVTSPISGFVTYSLLDAYRIVVAHEHKHFEQARRVTKTEGFPTE